MLSPECQKSLLYSYIHIATVGIKELTILYDNTLLHTTGHNISVPRRFHSGVSSVCFPSRQSVPETCCQRCFEPMVSLLQETPSSLVSSPSRHREPDASPSLSWTQQWQELDTRVNIPVNMSHQWRAFAIFQSIENTNSDVETDKKSRKI